MSTTNNYVQIIFVVKELTKTHKFTHGMLMAQAAHAGIKSIKTFENEEKTKKYLEDVDNMTTVILKIDSNDIDDIVNLCQRNSIKYVDWIEQPENILTAMATEIIDKNLIDVTSIFKKYRLY